MSAEKNFSKSVVSVILPCLNEEMAIVLCLEEILKVVKKNKFDAEIIVIDNGSTDSSLSILKKYKEKVPNLIIENEIVKGYGSAYRKGLSLAKGDIFFMADIDNTYDFNDIPRFIQEIQNGYDLVVGNRFSGKMKDRAMPHLHRYIGNPLLSFITRTLFKVPLKDIHCGARAITKKAFDSLYITTTGMEFASEMIIDASRKGCRMKEIPIDYRVRIGESKLKSFSDGWRHLRFMLIESPKTLFTVPGFTSMGVGLLGTILFYTQNPYFFGKQFYFHPLFLFIGLILVGYQLVCFGYFARIYRLNHLGHKDAELTKLFTYFTLEKGIALGVLLFVIGVVVFVTLFILWSQDNFGSIENTKNALIGLLIILLGIQTISASFIFSVLGIKR